MQGYAHCGLCGIDLSLSDPYNVANMRSHAASNGHFAYFAAARRHHFLMAAQFTEVAGLDDQDGLVPPPEPGKALATYKGEKDKKKRSLSGGGAPRRASGGEDSVVRQSIGTASTSSDL